MVFPFPSWERSQILNFFAHVPLVFQQKAAVARQEKTRLLIAIALAQWDYVENEDDRGKCLEFNWGMPWNSRAEKDV